MHSSLTRRLVGLAVILAAFAFAVSTFAQTGGATGKCLGEDGKPLVGYTIQVDRTEMRWSQHTKTNKKGEYTYIGLAPGQYKITLLDPSGKQIFYMTRHIGIGDPTVIDFDMGKERAMANKENPEAAKRLEEQQKEQKQYSGLKATFDQASTLYDQKHFSEAAAMYEQALAMAKDKNVPVVLARIADSYANAAKQEQNRDARLQDEQKAIDTYQKVLQITPNEAGMHNNLGGVYAEMGKIPEAKAEFQKAADINPPGASSYYYNLGVVLVNQGKMDDAAVVLKKATDLDPKEANAFYWYGMALLGKAEYKSDGTIVPVPGTVEAFQTYLKLEPTGQWAQPAQSSLDTLKTAVPTEFKAPKKKKS